MSIRYSGAWKVWNGLETVFAISLVSSANRLQSFPRPVLNLGRNEGVRRMQTAERAAVVGSPDLESLTTSHVERAFLTIRQELKRFQRKGLGYSKDLETHKRAVALFLGVYNFVRKHHSLGTTPAVAAGLEEKPWSLEHVVDMTAAYMRRKEDARPVHTGKRSPGRH